MKYKYLYILVLATGMVVTTACSSNGNVYVKQNGHVDETDKLFIYEDGRMVFESRFISREDVVIYDDGTGGERAAIKVRVPIHPDFYRDSIVVVRVEKVDGDVVTGLDNNVSDKMN